MQGLVIGQWRVERSLGRGGNAEVWAVQNVRIDARRALKVLDRSSDAVQVRLLREGRNQVQIEHPNILRVDAWLDFEDPTGERRVGLLMELAAGSLGSRPDLPQSVRLRLFRDALLGVAAIHERGFVHRDIKSDNLLLVSSMDGALLGKVADFGLARALDGSDRLSRPGEYRGTPEYSAPETFSGRWSPASDVFSLGVVLYEILADSLPYPAPEGGWYPFHVQRVIEAIEVRAREGYTPLSEAAPGIDPKLGDIVARCLRADPEQRFSDARALLAAFDEVLAPETVIPPIPPEPVPRLWVLVAMAALLVLSGVLAGAWVGGDEVVLVPAVPAPEEPQPRVVPEPIAPEPGPPAKGAPPRAAVGTVRLLYEGGTKPVLCREPGDKVAGGRPIEGGQQWSDLSPGDYVACQAGHVPLSDRFSVGGGSVTLSCASHPRRWCEIVR
jgi:hypothetical protein